MKNALAKLTVPLICSALVFSGCGTAGTKNYSAGQGTTNTGTKTNSTNSSSTQTSNKTNYGSRATSTNSAGTSSATGISGAGTSAILGTGGLSSALENQLRRAGINGTKVLVLDDTVILGQSSVGSTSGSSSNLSIAQSQIQSTLGDIRILTVNDAESLRAMDRVKSSLKTTNFSHVAVSADITTIIRSAKQSSSTIRPDTTPRTGSNSYSGSGSNAR